MMEGLYVAAILVLAWGIIELIYNLWLLGLLML